jgi:hypothetical protein
MQLSCIKQLQDISVYLTNIYNLLPNITGLHFESEEEEYQHQYGKHINGYSKDCKSLCRRQELRRRRRQRRSEILGNEEDELVKERDRSGNGFTLKRYTQPIHDWTRTEQTSLPPPEVFYPFGVLILTATK